MRTAVIGHASDKALEQHETCELALAAAIEALRPGVTPATYTWPRNG
ncbi:hypothetical protein [Actinophytocola sp.]|nr:hypothetical protein [Actinophytocola sp.]